MTTANGGDAWTWATSNPPTPHRRFISQTSPMIPHGHSFDKTTATLVIHKGDKLFAYVRR